MKYVKSQTMCVYVCVFVCVCKTCIVTTLELISSTFAVYFLTVFLVS